MDPLSALQKLDAELEARRPAIKHYEAYYDGDHRLQFATNKFREAFGQLFAAFADNWCDVVVDAAAERLEVEGFHFAGADTASTDAWELWTDNDLDTESDLAHTDAIKIGCSYVLVDTTVDPPLITVEHPAQTIVSYEAANKRKRQAALKKWQDDDGYMWAHLWLPGVMLRYRSRDEVKRDGFGVRRPVDWVLDGSVIAPAGDETIPVVELTNKPDTRGRSRSDIATVIPLQDGANKLMTDMIVASEFQAFRQRVLTGVEIPRDPDTGEPLPGQELRASMSRLWTFEPPDAEVHELGAADLKNYTEPIEAMVQHIAGQTRTPPYSLLATALINLSAETLTAADTGAVNKARGKQKAFKRAWREVIELATGKKPDKVLWKNPERQSLALIADAVVKLRTGGIISIEQSLEKLGYSPLEIKDAVDTMKLPAVPPPGAVTGGGQSVPTPGNPLNQPAPPPGA